MIFFVFRIWGQLKQYRFIRASLAGIQAASVGLTGVAVYAFINPIMISGDWIALGVIFFTFLLAQFTRLPSIVLFMMALLAGFFLG
jgi:chromate transporter